MTLLLLAGALVVAAAVVGGIALAVTSKRQYHAANQVIPGRPTNAPASWAGAHSPEARLHRRLADVVTALRSHPLLDEGTGRLEARVALEEQVAAIDEQLVAAAALPERVRAEPLARVERQVVAVEQAAATLAAAGGDATDPAAVERQVDDVRRQLEDLTRIRAELDAIPPTMPAPPAAEVVPAPAPPPPPPEPAPERRADPA